MRAGTFLYRQTLAGVLAALNDVDPYGLEPKTPEGAPQREYEMEAVDLTRMLLKNGVVTTLDLDSVWIRWFSESLVLRIGETRMARLVDSLNGIVSRAEIIDVHDLGRS